MSKRKNYKRKNKKKRLYGNNYILIEEDNNNFEEIELDPGIDELENGGTEKEETFQTVEDLKDELLKFLNTLQKVDMPIEYTVYKNGLKIKHGKEKTFINLEEAIWTTLETTNWIDLNYLEKKLNKVGLKALYDLYKYLKSESEVEAEIAFLNGKLEAGDFGPGFIN